MAVQAPDPSLDLRNRPYELVENVFFNADWFPHDNLNSLHHKLFANYHRQMPQQVRGPTMMLSNLQQWTAANACSHAAGQRKRTKDLSELHAEKRPRTRNTHQMTTCNASVDLLNEVRSMSALGLSLGQIPVNDLHPHVEDDGSIVTSSISNLVSLKDRLSAQISMQHDEILDLLKIQTEQLRLTIQERTQVHSKTFLATVGEGLSRTLRARDLELEQIRQKNMELEQKVNHLTLETQAWQSKAWSYDAMVSSLRTNLQHVLMHQTRCQSKLEGFGDSDNDASSAYVDVVGQQQQTRATLDMTSKAAVQRACKKCKSKEASILLLPCLHLSLCRECREDIETCPTCNFQICDRVEVHLS